VARRYLTPIDLTGLELTNFKVQNLTSNPTPYGAGHTYYNTVAQELRTYNGTAWDVVGGNVISGSTASRPAAGHAGRLYFDTQKSVLFFDNGTTWTQDGVTAQDLADAITDATLGSTDELSEGTTNLYFTDARAKTSAAELLTGVGTTLNNITITGTGAGLVITAENGVADSTTDDLEEGITNLYFTDQRAQDAIDDATMTLSNKTLDNSKVTGTTYFKDSNDVDYLTVSRSGTGTARITAADDLALRATNDIILYPGNDVSGHTGKAYIHWGNDATNAAPGNEIATVGTAQVFTNKTINDELFFTNPSTIPNDGGIKVNDSNENFEITAYVADLVLQTISGDITLTPATGNAVLVTSELHIDDITRIATDLFIGGVAYATNGSISVKYASGNDIFKADATSVDVSGDLNITKPDGGITAGTIYGDVDNNLVINASYNNLVLHSDSGNAYMNSVSDDNRIIKYSEIAALQSGLDWKQAVNLHVDAAEVTAKAITVDNGFLTSAIADGILILDGHTLVNADAGYRILVSGTGIATDGIWVLETVATLNWTATRATDVATYQELVGAAVFVMEGDVYAATSWVQSDHYLTSFAGQTWVQFSGQGTYIAGDGIAVTGQSISVKLDETNTSKSGLKEDGNGLSVKLKTNGLIKSTSDGLEVEIGAGLTKDANVVVIDTDVVVRKYAATIAQSGTTTDFTITHNLGTEDVTVSVYDTVTKEVVITDVTNFTTNTVKIGFAEAPADGAYRVVIHG
jgi:hypothetical protein